MLGDAPLRYSSNRFNPGNLENGDNGIVNLILSDPRCRPKGEQVWAFHNRMLSKAA